MTTAALLSVLALSLALVLGCGTGGLTPGTGGGDDTNGGNGGGGGGASATVTGRVVTSTGANAIGVTCYVVPTASPSTILYTATTNDQGRYSFTGVGLNQSLRVRAVDTENQTQGESGTFRPASDNLSITLPTITLSTQLPPAPPF